MRAAQRVVRLSEKVRALLHERENQLSQLAELTTARNALDGRSQLACRCLLA